MKNAARDNMCECHSYIVAVRREHRSNSLGCKIINATIQIRSCSNAYKSLLSIGTPFETPSWLSLTM